MAKPKRAYTEKQREEAMALLAVTTLSDASRKLGIAKSTLIQWRDGTVKCAQDCSEQYEQLRTEKKKEFINNAWGLIGKAQSLLDEKLDSDLQLPVEERKLKPMELTNIIGIQYDKQALASNEPTQNIHADIVKFEDLPI